jgi:hypothetical protein
MSRPPAKEHAMSDTKDDGLGTDGTIPESDDGIAVTLGEGSNFNPEEDEESDAGPTTEAGDEPMTS